MSRIPKIEHILPYSSNETLLLGLFLSFYHSSADNLPTAPTLCKQKCRQACRPANLQFVEIPVLNQIDVDNRLENVIWTGRNLIDVVYFADARQGRDGQPGLETGQMSVRRLSPMDQFYRSGPASC